MKHRLVSVLLMMIVVFSLSGNALAVVKDKVPDHHTATVQPDTGDQKRTEAAKYKEDELLVKFKHVVPEKNKDSLHKKHGSEKIKEFTSLRIHHVKLKKGLSVEKAVALYKAEPDVEYAEPNFIFTAQTTPDDPRFSELWGLHNTGQTGGTSDADIDAPEAWNITTGSSNVVVAVIDTGIDYSHEDLAANRWVNAGEIPGNGIDDDGNGYVDDVYGIDTYNHDSNPMDDQGHGTHVSGTIGAAGNNGIGVAGVNWNVKIIGCKFIGAGGSGYTSGAIECLQYIKALKDRAVNIVATNNSWGGGDYSLALADAIDAQREILFIAAAGNDGCDTDKTAFYPSGYYLPNIISVVATDNKDARALWSTQPDGCAPGSSYGRRTAHVSAPGSNIVSTIPVALYGISYGGMSGTSMATPHVTGLAALIKSQDANRDWKVVKNLILSGGDSIASMSGLSITGKRINAYGSLTCSNRPLFSVLKYPASFTVGVPTTLSAMSINCGFSTGPVTVTLSGGAIITLHDDGVSPDLAAGDGIFSATWTPSSSDAEVLTYTFPSGQELIAVPPIGMGDVVLAPPSVLINTTTIGCRYGASFSQMFSATGGKLPYTWSITSGSLPAGLTLNNLTGEIYGIPAADGIFGFTIEVTDAVFMKERKSWTIVVNKDIRDGWPKELAQRVGSGWLKKSLSPIFADLDHDGKDEIIVSDVNTLYVFNANGLVNKITLAGPVSAPAAADLDGDGDLEIIVSVSWPSLNPPLYAYHHNITPVTGFPAGGFASTNNSPGYCMTPVVQDLDNDGSGEIIVVCTPNNENDPNFNKAVLIVVDAHGVIRLGWPKILNGSSQWSGIQAQPAAGDIDSDGNKEIVFFTMDGVMHVFKPDGQEISQWVITQNSMTDVSGPFLADVNGDGYFEILLLSVAYVAGQREVKVDVFDRNGSSLAGWPKVFSPSYAIDPELVVADLDGDGRPEIIFPYWIPYYQGLQALRYDGSSLPGWPVNGGDYLLCTYDCAPVVGDINGDGKMDVVFNTSQWNGSYRVNAVDADGIAVPGYPKYTTPGNEIRSSPALGDIDGNKKVDIVTKSEDGMLYVWESPQQSAALHFEWPMIGRDYTHSGSRSTALSIQTFSLPLGVVGSAYAGAVQVKGGLPPYTWSISSGSLPPGLTLNVLSGQLTGAPAAEGPFSFTIRVTDRGAMADAKAFSLVVNNIPMTIMIPGASPVYLSLLQDALNEAADGDMLMIQATEFNENLVLNRPVSLIFSGGYDGGFSGNNGSTTLKGSLTIGDGTITIGSGAFSIY